MSRIHISEFEGGYPLKSGKRLTREDAEIIGREAGLDTSRKSSDDESLNIEKVSDGEGGYTVVHNNSVYRPYIYEKAPLPPLLIFISSSPTMKPRYTINLNTLKPTGNSEIQFGISEYIRLKYKYA